MDEQQAASPEQKRPLRVFFSAGEPSGDIHGANLIRDMKEYHPNVEAVGYGGPEMKAAGCDLHLDLTALAVMWVLRVLWNIRTFLGYVKQAGEYFDAHRPDAVVLIDFPGFNWWIASEAKKRGIPVFYYCPPQIWAWASWRIKKMRRYVDHVLCCLPFEEKWFRERGCTTTYIGHPFFDEVASQQVDEAFIAERRKEADRWVVMLPGSRTQEVAANMADFIKAAGAIAKTHPDARFAVAAFKESHAEMVRGMIAEAEAKGVAPPIDVFVKRTPELIRLAYCCMSVSGSVSLELLAHAKPTVILYKISRGAYPIQKFFRKVKYITLVNLLSTDELYPEDMSPYDPNQPDADRVLFPEYLTWKDCGPSIARHVNEWLDDPSAYGRRVEQLAELRDEVGHGGASKAAAKYILDEAAKAAAS